MWFGRYKKYHLDESLQIGLLSPTSLFSPDGFITNSPFHIIPILRPAIHSLADSYVAANTATLTKGLVNNRPGDSTLLSSTPSVWKLFLRVDTDRQEGLWGGGCVPFSLWTGSKCAGIITLQFGLLLLPTYTPRPIQAGNNDELILKSVQRMFR